MNWYYYDGQKQIGPITEEQLLQFYQSGAVNGDTLVWREGLANWIPFRQAMPGVATVATAPAAPPLQAAPTGSQAACVECGGVFNTDDMIRHGTAYVCANCKPIFMQKLSEGAARTMRSPGMMASEADILARDYDVPIGEYFSQAWNVFKAHAGILLGASIVVWIILMGTAVVLGFVPFGNVIGNLLIGSPLIAGLWLLYVRRVRGGGGQFADAFAGFGPRFGDLVMVNLAPVLVASGFMFLFGILILLVLPMPLSARPRGFPTMTMTPAVIWGMAILGVIAFIVMVYLNTSWLFAKALVLDKGMKFWPALELSRKVVAKHFWWTLLLTITTGLFGMLGVFGFCVGLLVTLPMAFTMLACHYERVLGDLAPVQR